MAQYGCARRRGGGGGLTGCGYHLRQGSFQPYTTSTSSQTGERVSSTPDPETIARSNLASMSMQTRLRSKNGMTTLLCLTEEKGQHPFLQVQSGQSMRADSGIEGSTRMKFTITR